MLNSNDPQPFGTRDGSRGRKFFHGLGVRGKVLDDSSALHLLCTSLYQLHLRLPSIKFQRLGTPTL